MQDFFCLAAEAAAAAAAATQLGRAFAIKSIPSFIHFAVSCKSICSVFFSAHNCHPFMYMFVLCSAHTIFYILFCVLLHTIAFLPCHIFLLFDLHTNSFLECILFVLCSAHKTPFLNDSADAGYVWQNVHCFLVCFFFSLSSSNQNTCASS